MLASSYLSDERRRIRNASRIIGGDWGAEEARKFIEKIANDPDMTPRQKENETYFFKSLVKECSEREKAAREEDEGGVRGWESMSS